MSYSIRFFVNSLRDGRGYISEFLRGAVGSFSGRVLGIGVGFLVQVLIARVLGVESFGVYSWVLAWVNALLLFAVAGFDVLLVRMMPMYIGSKDWGKLRGILRCSVLYVSALSLALSMAMWMIASRRHAMGDEYLNTFAIAALVLPLFALGSLRQAALRVYRAFWTAEVLESVIRPVVMAMALIVMVYGFHVAADGRTAMMSQLGASMLVFTLGSAWLVRMLPAHLYKEKYQTDFRLWLRTSLPFVAISGANAVSRQVGVLSLGAFGTAEEAGIFAAMARIAEFTALGTYMAATVAAPMIADLYHRGDRLELQRLVRFGTGISFGFTLLASAFFVVFDVTGAFGEQFGAGKEVLNILLVGQIMGGYSALVGYVMCMTGLGKQAAGLCWVSALLNAGACMILVPRLGAVGAAISALSFFIPQIVNLIIAKRRLGIWCGVY